VESTETESEEGDEKDEETELKVRSKEASFQV
jgi:hypothetical protein